jgi:hypothetical protein
MTRLALCGLMTATTSCEFFEREVPWELEDGCYYASAKPVFKVSGAEGRVLIPGDVKKFDVSRGKTLFWAWATFSPAFTFDDYDPQTGEPLTVVAYAERRPHTFQMERRTDGPTIQMFATASGSQAVTLGERC